MGDDSVSENFSIPISRRDFFKLAGLTTAGTLLNNTLETKKVEAAESKVNFDEKNIPTLMSADVCICGGGCAGTAAAINAAKNGAKVILIERGISLGGLQTLGCVFPMMPTKISGSDTLYILELNESFRKHGENPLTYRETEKYSNEGDGLGNYIPELLSLIYDEMCEQYGVEILYNTSVIGAKTFGGKITQCIIHTLEGIFAIDAKIFIDASGDAVLSRVAGVPVEKGSAQTGRNQPMSFRFEMGGVDIMKVYKFFTKKYNDDWSTNPPAFEFAKWKKNEEFFKKGAASGELTQDDILYIQAFTIPGKPNTMSMNCPEMPPLGFSSTDTISYSKAVIFGRKMIRRLAKFFVKNLPGFEKAYISREASILGVRESWRIHGKYYMTAEDYFGKKKFSDAICRTAYPIDIHDVKLDLYPKFKKGEFYEIPYRALVTNEFENLIVAGRCISADFSAQASIRIQPTCMSMGEAAGIAAAYSLKNNIAVNEIDWAKIPNRSYTSAG